MNKKTFVFLIIIVTIVFTSFLIIKYSMEATAISKLQLAIKNVEIQEIKTTYAKLKLIFDLSNPTNEYISELSTDFNIFITGNLVANGSTYPIDIPAKSTKETNSTIKIIFADVAYAVMNSILNLKFNLTIHGILHAKVLFGLFSISQEFSSSYSYT